MKDFDNANSNTTRYQCDNEETSSVSSFIEFLIKQKKNTDDDSGSSYRNKYREMRILLFILNKIKHSFKLRKYKSLSDNPKKILKKQKRKELRCITSIIALVYNNKLNLEEKLLRIQKIPSMSNLIAEIKKEACQQLIIADINKKNYEKQAKEGLKNGILGLTFDALAKIISNSITGELSVQPKRKQRSLSKKGSKKERAVFFRRKNSKKSTKILKESGLSDTQTIKKTLGHFVQQELKRRENSNIRDNYKNI